MRTIIFLSLSIGLFGQESPLTRERPLKKVFAQKGDTEVQAALCGEYLLFWANPQGVSPKGPRFAYNTQVMPGDPPNANLGFSFLKNVFVFVTDDSKKTPTAQLTVSNGVVTKVTVRISAQDRAKSRSCIP